MVLKVDGSVWATGDNQYGQLGDDTFVSKTNFVKVMPSGRSYAHTSTRGYYHLCVTRCSSTIFAVKTAGQDTLVLGQNRSTLNKRDNVDGRRGNDTKLHTLRVLSGLCETAARDWCTEIHNCAATNIFARWHCSTCVWAYACSFRSGLIPPPYLGFHSNFLLAHKWPLTLFPICGLALAISATLAQKHTYIHHTCKHDTKTS